MDTATNTTNQESAGVTNATGATNQQAQAKPVSTDPAIDFKSAIYRFRKGKDKDTGMELAARPSVELDRIPVPSVQGLANIFNAGGKGLELLMEAAQAIVLDRARDLINQDEKIEKEDQFDYAQLAWETIANLPKSDRRAGLPDELWDEFQKDFVDVMPAITGKSAEQNAAIAKLFRQKLAPVKTKKDILPKLQMRLDMYTEAAPRANEFVDIIEYLNGRIKSLLEAQEANTEEALGL